MTNTVLFSTGLFCFFLAIVGVVLTVQEFKNMELKEKLKDKKKYVDTLWRCILKIALIV